MVEWAELAEPEGRAVDSGFAVSLDVYSGPFDVLLGMIAGNRLELTEVSLSAITEEFLEYVRGMDVARNMEAASSFIDVASILVEAKSAALLPGDEDGGRDERSMEALRERDLLFARLLQYRAFKQAADDFRARLAANSGRFPHPAVMDAGMPASEVSVHQLHMPMVDLRAQSMLVRDRLRALPAGGSMTFAELTADAAGAIEVVARFLAVLAFFKQGVLQFRQAGPYETLHLRWVAGAEETDTAIDERDFA